MSIFKTQLLALGVLSAGVFSGMSIDTPFGYFCAGINFGGMIYFVGFMRKDRMRNEQIRLMEQGAEVMQKLLRDPRIVQLMKEAGLVEMPPHGGQAPEKQTQPPDGNR